MVEDLVMLKKNLLESFSQQELNEKYTAQLQRALNKRLMNLINNNQQGDQLVKSNKNDGGLHFINIERFFEFLQSLERMELISKIDIFNTFADLFDCTSEDTLAPLFNMMEQKMFNGHIINVQSADNKGKVQKLIASVFPLTHPSGLNRQGNFNAKNQTNFESLEEIKGDIESKGSGQVSDYNLYKNFWNLQKYLTNPFIIFTSSKLDFEDIEENQNENNINDNDALEFMEQNSDNNAIQDEEEGQAEDIIENNGSASIDDRSSLASRSAVKSSSESNLTQVLSTIRDFIAKFMSQPIQVDKDNAQILLKYPKYLSKYSLLNLQFQDYLFRENFLTQVMIFQQTIMSPLNPQQKKYFVITEDEKKLIANIENKVFQLLSDSIETFHQQNTKSKHSKTLGKRKTMSECVQSIIEREIPWDKWKENKCVNFEKPPSTLIKNKKRDLKRAERLIGNAPLVQARDKEFNFAKNGLNLRKYLRYPKESFDQEGNSMNIKPADLPLMSDFHTPLLKDMDPDQCIEEPYKNKHNQVFSWRFLRQVSFVDLVNFHGRPEVHKQFHKFEGNAEEQALILYNRNKRKQIEFGGVDAIIENGSVSVAQTTKIAVVITTDEDQKMQDQTKDNDNNQKNGENGGTHM